MTLKIRSRSPKYDLLFYSSQQCIYASLVQIHPLIQRIMQGTLFWTFQSALVILKFMSMSPKFDVAFPSSSMQVWSKSNHYFRRQRTETIFWTFQSAAVTLKTKSTSPKSNQLVSPPNNVYMQVLVKIHSIVQKIMQGKEATRTPILTGSAPKTICPPPLFGFGGHNNMDPESSLTCHHSVCFHDSLKCT